MLEHDADHLNATLLIEALAALHQFFWLYLPVSDYHLYSSPQLLELCGLDPNQAPQDHKPWLPFIHPDDRGSLLQGIEQLQADGEPLVLEHRILTAQGQIRWMQATIRLFTSTSGQLIQAGSLIDISSRKAAELRLRSSEQRFESIFTHLSEAVVLSQPDGSILMANPAATRLFGYSESELMAGGRALILDEQDTTYQAHHQLWQASTKATSRLTFKRRDGSLFLGETSSVPFQLESGETQLASLVRDLSQELEFLQTTRQLYEISEAMPGAIYQFCLTPDGRISFPFMSRSAQLQWGYTAENLEQSPEGFLGMVHPDDREALLASTAESARNLTPWMLKFRGWDHHLGAYRWIRGQTIPSRQPDGSILWNGTLLDIDEAEKNLQQLEAQRLQLQAILDSIGEGITVVDREGRIQLINQRGQQLLGMGATEAPPEDWPRIYGLYYPDGVTPCPTEELPSLRALKGERVHNFEMWIHSATGQKNYLLFTATPLLDAQQQVTGAVSVYRDITALYLAEQQLRQTSERMKYLLERFNLGFMTLTHDWKVSYFNRAAWELTGQVLSQQLMTTSIWTLFPECFSLNLKIYTEYHRAVAENVSVHFTDYYPPLDAWFEINAYPFQGELDVFFQVVTDTRRHEALVELEKELLAIQLDFDRSPEDIIDTALQGLEPIFPNRRFLLLRLTDWGPQLPKLLGSRGFQTDGVSFEASSLPEDLSTWFEAQSGQLWQACEGPLGELMTRTQSNAMRLLALHSRSGELIGALLVLYERADWAGHDHETAFLTSGANLLCKVLEAWLAGWRLRLSNERFALASRATSDIIWDDDLITGQLVINQALCDLLGYPQSQLNTRHEWWIEQIHPQDRDRVQAGWELAVAKHQQHWEDEYRFSAADGSYRYIYDRGYILYSAAGQPQRMIGSMQDITSRREIEAALRESHQRYELAGLATRDVIWDWDLTDQSLTFTTSIHEAFGYSPPASRQGSQWWYQTIHPDERDQVRLSLQAHTESHQHHWQQEYRFRHADGSYRDVLDRGYTLWDAQDRPIRMIGAIQDITTLKAHERQISDQNERLLAIAWQQSHEVRRPLANILGLLKLSENELPRDKQLSLMEHEALVLDRIIAEIVEKSQSVLAHEAGQKPNLP